MPFRQKVKTQALTLARRCCCICHQFAGLYTNVHHIVPESQLILTHNRGCWTPEVFEDVGRRREP